MTNTTRLPQFEDYIFKFKGEFEPPLNRIFLIAINKKTAEEIIIGKMRKNSETYSTDGGRISNKSRIVYDFTWSRDPLPILFGHEKVRAGSPRISSGLDLSATSTYSKLSLIFFKNQLKAAFEKYNKTTKNKYE